MHSNNIMHRDLKPENIMCDGELGKDLTIKLTDFGFATMFRSGEKQNLALGTPSFMAPELIRCKAYDQRVDVWSLGCIVYILLSGRYPFDAQEQDEVERQILRGKPDLTSTKWLKVSPNAKDFIR